MVGKACRVGSRVLAAFGAALLLLSFVVLVPQQALADSHNPYGAGGCSSCSTKCDYDTVDKDCNKPADGIECTGTNCSACSCKLNTVGKCPCA